MHRASQRRVVALLAPLALLASSCFCAGCGDDDEAPALRVDVRTDYLPGVEFTRVRVEAGPADGSEAPRSLEAAAASLDPLDWLAGQHVAEVSGLSAGATRVAVSLLRGDGIIVGRQPVIFLYDSDEQTQTVTVTRDCEGVTCPAAGDPSTMAACFSGMCADEACSSANPFACPGPACTSDGECAAGTPSCAAGRCIAGRCFITPDGTLCDGGVCDPTTGCGMGDGDAPDSAVDGGPTDGGA